MIGKQNLSNYPCLFVFSTFLFCAALEGRKMLFFQKAQKLF